MRPGDDALAIGGECDGIDRALMLINEENGVLGIALAMPPTSIMLEKRGRNICAISEPGGVKGRADK